MKKTDFQNYKTDFQNNKQALSKFLDIENSMIDDYIPIEILMSHIEQLFTEQYSDMPLELKLKLINLASSLNTSTKLNHIQV